MTPKKKTAKKTTKKKKLPSFFYVIRACPPALVSTNNFNWPAAGPVKAPDFRRDGQCGYGLHGWASLEDIGRSFPDWFSAGRIGDYVWLIVKVPFRNKRALNYQQLNGKVKFGKGVVVFHTLWILAAIREFARLTKGRRQP
jgi:hypothetical protein